MFLLSLSAFSVRYNYNIFKMNTFINLLLVKIILLTKLSCFRKFFILYISQTSSFLRSNLNTDIVFQSFKTNLLLNTLEVSCFSKGLCVFTILSIIALNFSKFNVQIRFFRNILKNIGYALHIFIFIFFISNAFGVLYFLQ